MMDPKDGPSAPARRKPPSTMDSSSYSYVPGLAARMARVRLAVVMSMARRSSASSADDFRARKLSTTDWASSTCSSIAR